MAEWRLREVRYISQGPTARRDCNLDSLTPDVMIFHKTGTSQFVFLRTNVHGCYIIDSKKTFFF